MRKKRIKKFLIFIVIVAVTSISIFPLIWMFLASFKTHREIFATPPVFLPKTPMLSSYISLLTGAFPRTPYLINSIVIALSTTLFTIIIATMAAFGFAHFKIPRSRDIEFWILSIRMMPPIVAVIPLFLWWRNLGFFDTRIGLTLVYTAFNLPFSIWMITLFFRELPREIEEAAVVDGASTFSLLRYISLPLIVPGLAVVTIFVFYLTWNELLLALILTGRNAKTLAVSISEFSGLRNVRWGLASAASVIHVLPVIIVTFVIQKYIITGLTLGALKK